MFSLPELIGALGYRGDKGNGARVPVRSVVSCSNLTDVLLSNEVHASRSQMMKFQMVKWSAMFGLLAMLAVFGSGCGQATNDGGSEPAADASHEDEEDTAHAGWWCV